MSKFIVDYGKAVPPAADGRLDGPAFHRNNEPIWAAMAGWLQGNTGDVVEIGSGTGQHIAAFASRTPNLVWWPSDIHASHLASIAAWRLHTGLQNLRAPQRIDLTDAGWTWVGERSPGGLAAVVCINVLHIAPWRVAQNLISGAGRLLRGDGRLFIYGPFKRDGAHTAPSNADFDASLRAENPEWGVRDIGSLSALAQAAGLTLAETTPMPANNLVLAFARDVRPLDFDIPHSHDVTHAT